jgi:hypothetical protein
VLQQAEIGSTATSERQLDFARTRDDAWLNLGFAIEVERLKESRNLDLLLSKKSYAMEIAIKPARHW